MKTLIIGAGPLGSLYAVLIKKAGFDVTILARNEHYNFLKQQGVVLVNEFTHQKIVEQVPVIDAISKDDNYELAIVIMRKNSVKQLLPELSRYGNVRQFLFMGNNTLGFHEYLEHLPLERILFGFPGGGGSRLDHVIHYIDTEKPNGKRMPVVIGEVDGRFRERTDSIKKLFEKSGVPVKLIDDMDGWLKYHVAFVLPVAGALLKSGDNYTLAKDKETIRTYIRAVKEGGRVLKSLGYKKSFNTKFKLFYWFPEGLLISILKKVFDSRFAEIAMMMHVRAARDEMIELAKEFDSLRDQASVETPNIDELNSYIIPD